jgi:CheY-like chemotaxis protein
MVQLLASWNGVVRGAGSAREALDLLARERVDLLVSDIAMPGEDGYALVAELRRRERGAGGPRLPATALTAFARPEDRRRMLDAGFDAHVAKPVEPEELYAALTALRPPPAVASPAGLGPGGANRALVPAGPALATAPGRNGAAPVHAAGPGPRPGV